MIYVSNRIMNYLLFLEIHDLFSVVGSLAEVVVGWVTGDYCG